MNVTVRLWLTWNSIKIIENHKKSTASHLVNIQFVTKAYTMHKQRFLYKTSHFFKYIFTGASNFQGLSQYQATENFSTSLSMGSHRAIYSCTGLKESLAHSLSS